MSETATPSQDVNAAEMKEYLSRQKRLSLQYGAATLVLALVAVVLDIAALALLVWAVFAFWLLLRMKAARQLAEKSLGAAKDGT